MKGPVNHSPTADLHRIFTQFSAEHCQREEINLFGMACDVALSLCCSQRKRPVSAFVLIHPPCRSFILQRILSGESYGRSILFFGCRRSDQDYLYGDVLEDWAKDGRIQLHTAFSRQQVHNLSHCVSIALVVSWRIQHMPGTQTPIKILIPHYFSYFFHA